MEELLKDKKWKGFGFFDESRRFYPNGEMAANVLGFVGYDDKGLDGLEKSLDTLIRGGTNKQHILTDARGNPILKSAMAPYKADKERSVYLTIDQNIQFYAERALDRAMSETHANGGIILVMDPKTGAILALGNRPSYDPNNFDKATEAEFKNRAVVDIYEPGSTFKPIIASAALSAGTYDTQRVWHDPGAVWASGHAIRNWDDGSYGDVRILSIHFPAKCGDFVILPIHHHNDRAETTAAAIDSLPALPAGNGHGLLRPSGGGNIPVMGNTAHEQVPHTAAHHKSLFPLPAKCRKDRKSPFINFPDSFILGRDLEPVLPEIVGNAVNETHGQPLFEISHQSLM
jgi:hypothetical protein